MRDGPAAPARPARVRTAARHPHLASCAVMGSELRAGTLAPAPARVRVRVREGRPLCLRFLHLRGREPGRTDGWPAICARVAESGVGRFESGLAGRGLRVEGSASASASTRAMVVTRR
ncbi:hypothetical protein AcV7_005483 [Taiwanofungus camphoratus]|nr:hypothetical protein AcV7_005483 [Antrodia cinnamomea]